MIFRLESILRVPGAVSTAFPRVITPLGTIEGYYKTSNSGRTYEAYEGIPYAEPPIGDYRFRVRDECPQVEVVYVCKILSEVITETF